MKYENMEYNTDRNYLSMREYGRHIQKMVEYVLTIEDRDKRNLQAKAVIELMGFLNPHLRNVEDFRHMLWDHLFFISDFKLDVDSPYPIPQKETYKGKPDPLPYPRRYPKYTHLGKNLELVIEKALKESDPEKKAGFANSIAYYMKLAYSSWHKELVHDDAIRIELDSITEVNWNLALPLSLNTATRILKGTIIHVLIIIIAGKTLVAVITDQVMVAVITAPVVVATIITGQAAIATIIMAIIVTVITTEREVATATGRVAEDMIITATTIITAILRKGISLYYLFFI